MIKPIDYKTLRKQYKQHVTDKAFLLSLAASFGFLFLSLIINFYAGLYATVEASNPVTDIILSNIPVFDVDGIFIYGGYALVVCMLLSVLVYPHRLPFVVKSVSLFLIVRSLFVALTHIGPFPTHIIIDPLSLMRFFNFDGQLFFSGHAGLPFLMALIFWDNKRLRVSFVTLSVILGAVVLMGHLHYSIDVFAAFFITYGIYKLSTILFKKDAAFKGLDNPVA